jgi:hypothetical protein
LAKITLFCPKCSEANTDETKNCIKCGELLEGPSKDFIEEISMDNMKKVELKDILPGIKVGAIAGIISGLFWGLPKLLIFTSGCLGYKGIIILPIYLISNIIFGIITGSVLAFFGELGNMSPIKSIIINILISLTLNIPLTILPAIIAGSTMPIFFAVIISIISGTMGGGIFGYTIPIIYNQYIKKY